MKTKEELIVTDPSLEAFVDIRDLILMQNMKLDSISRALWALNERLKTVCFSDGIKTIKLD